MIADSTPRRGTGDEPPGVRVRAMGPEDVAAVALLSGQLGYPSTEEQVRRRFEWLKRQGDRATFVADDGDGRVIGWVHVAIQCTIETGPNGEVWGLVVDETARNRRVGRLLMSAAEQWACDRGLAEMAVRSNVIRGDAHRFYLSIGYEIAKSQYKFRKRLGPSPPA